MAGVNATAASQRANRPAASFAVRCPFGASRWRRLHATVFVALRVPAVRERHRGFGLSTSFDIDAGMILGLADPARFVVQDALAWELPDTADSVEIAR